MKKDTIVICSLVLLLSICVQSPLAHAFTLSPDQPGPYHVGSCKVWYLVPPYGLYRAVIRYPATIDGRRAPVDASEAPYPGIVVANGFAGSESQITWIPEHLTSYGYVTLCFTPPRRLSWDTTQWAQGFLGGVNALQKQNNRRFSPLYHLLDGETWGAIGLSMGGGGCVEATGTAGSLIDASVALAPAGFPAVYAAARNITVPIQLQVGTEDRLVPPNNVLELYEEHLTNETTKEYLAITGGNHIGYIDEQYADLAQKWGIDNTPGITVEQQHNISRKYFTAWFQYHLRHLDEYYPFIFGQEAEQDLEDGILADLRFNIS
jgi:dienelactone hydrolase